MTENSLRARKNMIDDKTTEVTKIVSLITFFLLLVLTVILNILHFSSLSSNLENHIDDQHQYISIYFHHEEAALKSWLKLQIEEIGSRPNIKKAFFLGDRKTLLRETRVWFNILKKSEPEFALFHFHKYDGTSLLRVHELESFGDKIESLRSMVKYAHKSRKLVYGYEIGRAGPMFCMIKPVYYKQKYIGALEMGVAIGDMMDRVSLMLQSKGIILTRKKEPLPGTDDTNIGFSDFSFSSTLIDPFFKELITILQGKKIKSHEEVVKCNHKHYHVHPFPVYDFSGRTALIYLMVMDVSPLYGKYYTRFIFGIVFSLVVLIIIYGTLILIMNRLLRNTIRSRREFGQLFHSLSVGILVQDKEGNTMFANPAVERLTGWTKEDLKGKHHHELLHHTDEFGNPNPLSSCPIHLSYMNNRVYSIKKDIFWTKQGTILPVRYTANPLKDQFDNVVGSAISFTDITKEMKLYEEKEKALGEAQKAANAKSIFLSHMSHEIRTPLNSIIGLTDLLNETDLTKEQKEYTSIILKGSRHLLNLINDVLDFSKLESGNVELAQEKISLSLIMDEVLLEMSVIVRSKPVNLVKNIDPLLPDFLWGDSIRLKEIFYNMVSNALKFTRRGSVTISASQKNVDEDRVEVLFSVKDTGVGISNSDKEVIFESFQQGTAMSNSSLKGTGLGLSICRELINLMGGTIWVESEQGEGTTFYFTITFRSAGNDISEKQVKLSGEVNKSLRILVAEDNYLSQRFAIALFKKIGLDVDIAKDGKEALTLMKENEYDIIFMDIEMPELTGIDLVRLIRKGEAGIRSDVKVIACTAHAFLEDREHFITAGMDDYIMKPYMKKDIIAILLKYC